MKAIIFILLLTSCAAQQPVFKPVTVEIPVSAPCHTAAITQPDFALTHIGPANNLFEKTQAALVELDQRKAYETEMAAALAVCR